MIKVNIVIKRLVYFIVLSCAASCSSIDKTVPISHIQITTQGMHPSERTEMAPVCKGFIMSEDKVIAFYKNSALTHEENTEKKYKVLPCFSTGSAYLYGEKYNWIIRSGGVGEFYNDNKRFVKICGIKCCSKIRGIC